MPKKTVSLILILTMVLTLASAVSAASPSLPQEQEATILRDLGLFAGTDKGFELDRAPTRTEAVVLLLRMLGKEQEAKDGNFKHPFKDVPAWADKQIGYAYEKGLTTGTTKTTFGSNDNTTPEQFITFTLRALGYSDKDGKDFTFKDSINMGVKVGLVGNGEYASGSKSFIRGDCVSIIYSALDKKLNGSEERLIDKLVAGNIVPMGKAAEAGFVQNGKTESKSDIISFDTGVYAEIGEASSVMAYIKKSELPAELQSAVYFSVTSISGDVTLDEFKSWIAEYNEKASLEKMTNAAQIEGIDGTSGTRVDAGNIAAIKLFDANGRVIGVKLVKPQELISGDPHFIYFEISYSGAFDLPTGDNRPYMVKRYINGVEDVSFEQPKGGPFGSTGEAGKDLHISFRTPVLFVKDSSVTYEIIDLTPSIPKDISQRVYGN